jgi:hypothetical protein
MTIEKSSSADAALERMGYKSELPRHLGMLSVLGLYVSFFLLFFLRRTYQ